jgi:hypothetical protein
MTITKETVEQYNIRGPNGLWAIITVNPSKLLLQISSDYGDWGYRWSNIGSMTFKRFLVGLGSDYLIDKLTGAAREPDLQATMSKMDETILRLRREKVIDADQAREAYDCWEDLKSDLPSSGEALSDLMYRELGHIVCEPEDIYESIVERQAHDCVAFYENIWKPHFVPALNAETAMMMSAA